MWILINLLAIVATSLSAGYSLANRDKFGWYLNMCLMGMNLGIVGAELMK